MAKLTLQEKSAKNIDSIIERTCSWLDSFIQDTGIPSEPLGTRLLKPQSLDKMSNFNSFAAKVTLMIDEDGKDILK